jgi:hypothetical protein
MRKVTSYVELRIVSNRLCYVRFEVYTAVTMKNAVFWDVAPCRSCVTRCFGGTYRLHLQGRKIHERGTNVSSLQPSAHAGSTLADFSTIKVEAIRSSETSVHTRSTRRHFPEYGILQRFRYVCVLRSLGLDQRKNDRILCWAV